MNETDADISVSGKSDKKRQPVSKYTKQCFPAPSLRCLCPFFTGIFRYFPNPESFFLLNNWIYGYALHFSDMIPECPSGHLFDRLSVLCHFHSPDLYTAGEKAAYRSRPAGPKKFHSPQKLCPCIRIVPFCIRFRSCRYRF